MNEELMIQIKAKVDDALKKINEVQEELKDVGKESQKAGNQMADSMKEATRTAMLQVAAIKQLATELINLGQSTIEAQKEIARLNAAFEASGSSAKQAGETYKNIFGFLGDSQAAVEAAQQLANITPDADKLKEYETALMGVYARFGTSIETGGLAEGINHTIMLGEVQGTLADAFEFVGMSVEGVNAQLANLNSTTEREAYLRALLLDIYGQSASVYAQNNASLIAYNKSQAQLNVALAEAGRVIMPLLTAFNNLAAILLTTLRPALETIVAVFVAVIEYVAAAIKWIAAFFSLFKGKSSVSSSTNAIASDLSAAGTGAKIATGGVNGLNKALGGAAAAAKELKRQTMGFDELNIVRDETTTSSGGGGGAGGSIDVPDMGALNGLDFSGIMDSLDLGALDDFQKKVDKIKDKLEGLGVLVATVGAGLLAWKITDALTHMDNLKGKLQDVAGKVMIVAGAMLLVKGYTDAWTNGIDWGNLTTMLSGVALVIGGVFLAFGEGAAAIATVVGGVAIFIISLKDIIENGLNAQNAFGLLAGAILAVIPVVLAFNGAISANPIGATIALIAALIAGITALIAIFKAEETAIKSTEDALVSLQEAQEKLNEATNNHINAVDAAEAAYDKLREVEKKYRIDGEALFEAVANGTLTYEQMTDSQREVYKAYLDNEKKQKELKKSTDELIQAKKDETRASFENQAALAKESGDYETYKKSVIDAFENGTLSAEEARDLIELAMSEMSKSAQQTFGADLPKEINDGLDPNRYATKRKKFTDFISGAWQVIKDQFNRRLAPLFTADYWSNLWSNVTKPFKTAINAILSGIESAINWVVKQLNKLSFTVPDWVPGIGGERFGFNLKEIKLARLAEGGIVTQSMIANIGERGKEAVLPLENNTEWMDILADRIAERNKGETRVIMQIGERELGWATIGAINNITKQMGGLQLKL